MMMKRRKVEVEVGRSAVVLIEDIALLPRQTFQPRQPQPLFVYETSLNNSDGDGDHHDYVTTAALFAAAAAAAASPLPPISFVS